MALAFAEDDIDTNQYNDDEHENPEWLVELPDDLDVCIAERDFEYAAALIDKGYFENYYFNFHCFFSSSV